jgi:hypothetical protein
MPENTHPHPAEESTLTVRRPYEKPKITRVDLALAETLSEGCKLDSDFKCVGPPVQALQGGS